MENTTLIERAIESAKCRIYRVRANVGESLAHQVKVDNQVEIQQVTIEALEKQIAKKPCVGNDKQGDITCPHCKGILGFVDCWQLHSYNKHCPTCGQKLDWK